MDMTTQCRWYQIIANTMFKKLILDLVKALLCPDFTLYFGFRHMSHTIPKNTEGAAAILDFENHQY